jgi:hypothetical protein
VKSELQGAVSYRLIFCIGINGMNCTVTVRSQGLSPANANRNFTVNTIVYDTQFTYSATADVPAAVIQIAFDDQDGNAQYAIDLNKAGDDNLGSIKVPIQVQEVPTEQPSVSPSFSPSRAPSPVCRL